MEPARWQNIQNLFREALAIEPESRATFIEQACEGDAEMKAEVESLLESDSESGEFLATLPIRISDDLASKDDSAELLGKRVGKYHIQSVIAVGGMGIVYTAVPRISQMQLSWMA